MTNTNYGPIPCPTCGQSNSEPCIRGSKFGAIWERGEIFSQGHDSRRSANTKGAP